MEAMDLVNWDILLRFFQLEIAEDIWAELNISTLPTEPIKTHKYLKWNVLFVNYDTVMLCVNGSWFHYIVCHGSCSEGKDGGLLAFMEMLMFTYDGGRNAKGGWTGEAQMARPPHQNKGSHHGIERK